MTRREKAAKELTESLIDLRDAERALKRAQDRVNTARQEANRANYEQDQ